MDVLRISKVTNRFLPCLRQAAATFVRFLNTIFIYLQPVVNTESPIVDESSAAADDNKSSVEEDNLRKTESRLSCITESFENYKNESEKRLLVCGFYFVFHTFVFVISFVLV